MEFWDNGRSSFLCFLFLLLGCGLLGNVMWMGMGMGIVMELMGFARYALFLDGIE